MRLPDSLRAWLLRSVPGLETDPTRLHIYHGEDSGRIVAQRGATLSYRLGYDLIVFVEDMAHDLHALIVPVLAWIAANQPELMDADPAGIPFSVQILDNKTADIEIRLALSETVIVTPTETGGWTVTYPERPAFPAIFDGAPDARLWQLWLDSFGDHHLAAVHPDHLPQP